MNKMSKGRFPLIDKYIIENETDFYNFFSLERLNEFEKSLYLYYETDDICSNDFGELYSRTNTYFNNDIICLSEGIIQYDDFISDYREEFQIPCKNHEKSKENSIDIDYNYD